MIIWHHHSCFIGASSCLFEASKWPCDQLNAPCRENSKWAWQAIVKHFPKFETCTRQASQLQVFHLPQVMKLIGCYFELATVFACGKEKSQSLALWLSISMCIWCFLHKFSLLQLTLGKELPASWPWSGFKCLPFLFLLHSPKISYCLALPCTFPLRISPKLFRREATHVNAFGIHLPQAATQNAMLLGHKQLITNHVNKGYARRNAKRMSLLAITRQGA